LNIKDADGLNDTSGPLTQERIDISYFKNLVSAHKIGQKYLVFGEWVRPPQLEVETQVLRIAGCKEGDRTYDCTYVQPKVLASCFKIIATIH